MTHTSDNAPSPVRAAGVGPLLGLVDRGGRCPVQGTHRPVWGRADVAELTDHPRGLRYPAEIAHGVTVWVTRCGSCEAPLLIVGPWGTGRFDPPATPPPVVLELTGAELSADSRAALDAGHASLRPPSPSSSSSPPSSFGGSGSSRWV
ncbi:hypothetical protein ACFYTC_48445 [Actinomadura nitritigenes]|uniref:hypothetical protein n=1 Tax=Actinomadura nitritigenes TaxID=134602 RepID=UPI003698AC54